MLFTKLKRLKISSDDYSNQWFLTLLGYDTPAEVYPLVLDLFLLKGFKIIFKLIIYMIKLNERTFKIMDFENLMRELPKCIKKLNRVIV